MLTAPKKLKTVSKIKATKPVVLNKAREIVRKLFNECSDLNDLRDYFEASCFNHCCGVTEISCEDFIAVVDNYPEAAVEILAGLMGVHEPYADERDSYGAAAMQFTDTKRHPVLEAIADTIELGKNPKTGNSPYMWIIRACDIEELRERFKDYGKVVKKKA